MSTSAEFHLCILPFTIGNSLILFLLPADKSAQDRVATLDPKWKQPAWRMADLNVRQDKRYNYCSNHKETGGQLHSEKKATDLNGKNFPPYPNKTLFPDVSPKTWERERSHSLRKESKNSRTDLLPSFRCIQLLGKTRVTTTQRTKRIPHKTLSTEPVDRVQKGCPRGQGKALAVIARAVLWEKRAGLQPRPRGSFHSLGRPYFALTFYRSY